MGRRLNKFAYILGRVIGIVLLFTVVFVVASIAYTAVSGIIKGLEDSSK